MHADLPTLTVPEPIDRNLAESVNEGHQTWPVLQAFTDGLQWPTSDVSVVTAVTDDNDRCGTATSLCHLASEPPALITCVRRNSTLGKQLLRSKLFCVNILSPGQRDIAEAFSRMSSAEAFQYGRWTVGKTGAPMLDGAVASIECSVKLIYAYPVHLLVVGSSDEVAHREKPEEPLVDLSHLQPTTDALPAATAMASAR